jgi:hypothetical protein
LLAPAAASLRIKDFRKVSFADRIIRAIRDNNGVGRARHARIVLSGMCCSPFGWMRWTTTRSGS